MSATTTVLGSVGRVDLHKLSTSVLSFVGKFLGEVTPCRIHDAFGETMVLLHPVHREVFYRNETVAVNKLAALLVGEVRAFVLDALVYFRYYLAPLRALPAAFGSFGESSLGTCKLPLLFPKELRSRYGSAVRCGDDGLEANVYTNRLLRLRQWFGPNFAREAHEPLTRGSLAYRSGLDLSLKRTVDHSFDMAYLGEENPIAFYLEAALRVRERIVVVGSTEARIARLFSCLGPTKERLESEVYTNGDVLQHLRMNFSQSRVHLLARRVTRMLRIQGRRLARFLVGVSSLGEQFVVQTPAFPEGLNHLALLGGSREYPVAKCFTHEANYTIKARVGVREFIPFAEAAGFLPATK